MYGKVFEQMYHGSMVVSGWEAIVTMQQLIVLADREGVVDMTNWAISNLTTIPLDIIDKGLEALSKPDPHSRSKEEEGRRIVLLDPSRQWGWRLVNYKYYAGLASKEDKREKDAIRLAEKRNAINNSQDVASCRNMSQIVENVAYVDVDVNIDNTTTSVPGLDPEIWKAFKSHRVAIKAKLTPYAEKLLLNSLCRIIADGSDPNAIVCRSIENGWKGFWPMKEKPASDHFKGAV